MDQTVDFESAYIAPKLKILLDELEDGAEIGEPARVTALADLFSWKMGFINCWTGLGNDGKTTYGLFMSLLKAHFDKTKVGIWTPEMISSHRVVDTNGKVEIVRSANDIYNELIWMLTGKTVYKHIAEKHKEVQRIGKEEYMAALEFIEQHFFVINPKDRTHKGIIDAFRFYYEKFGISIFWADPFKAFKIETTERTDIMMNEYFAESKEFSIDTHSSFNYIAHPKNLTDVREKGKNGEKGAYKICDQYMIAGGQAWDNNMDGIYSIYRPERHLNPTDPKTHFYNLKQRKEELVGHRGEYTKIVFDRLRRRYFFDNICPLDGSNFKTPDWAKPDLFSSSKTQDSPF